jgi:hypothetical protein
MTNYNKFWVALAGLAALVALPILSKIYQIDFSQQTQLIMNLVIAALTAAGVYQVPNIKKDGE